MITDMWHQEDFYRIRKKVLTIGSKYWIEDSAGNVMGFCKQKLLRLKEDIRIYSDESMSKELFHIKQQQMTDIWGNFAVIDAYTNANLGYFQRKGLKSSFAKDEWEIYDEAQQPIGRMYESSLGRALARKYIPYVGVLIPEKVILELDGRPVAEIHQRFKIVGDIWEIDCQNIPLDFDRRVPLSCILLMGTIERRHKGTPLPLPG